MKTMKKYIAIFLCFVVLCSGFTVQAENEQIKISDKEYLLELDGKVNTFIGNQKPVDGEIGTKVFLTYTVEKIIERTATMNGVVAALNREDPWPYTSGGGMHFRGGMTLFDEGYTYVIRMERTEEGFEYQCVKLKEGESEYIKLSNYEGEKHGDFKYFGVWIGGEPGQGLSAVLTHVRCYDENGNDLGVLPADSVNQANANEELLDVHLTVNHAYDFSVKSGFNLAISNKKAVYDSDAVIYMEYEVAEVTKDETVQTGLVLSNAPTSGYPHSSGQMQWRGCSGSNPLLRPGGKYFICFAKETDGFKGIVQCTLDGETDTFIYSGVVGTYDASYGYYSLWLAEGGSFDCTIKNFKCYDSDGNNLGVQFNSSSITVSHQGELEDYSTVQEMYYCEENGGLLVLEDEQKAYVELDGVRNEATYKIVDDVMTLYFEDGKEMWVCDYIVFTDEDGNQYNRLKTSKVTFVSEGETFEQEANKENGYHIEEPEKPVKEGNEFLGWYRKDGSEFDFNSVVSESITLYAKWRDGHGNEYLSDDNDSDKLNIHLLIAVGATVVMIAAFTTGCVLIGRRQKDAAGKEKKWKNK